MSTRYIYAPAILAIALSFPVPSLLAQARRTVKGNLHPKAESRFDRGPVAHSVAPGERVLGEARRPRPRLPMR